MPTPPPPPVVDRHVPTPHLGVVFGYAPLSEEVILSWSYVLNSRFETDNVGDLQWGVAAGTTRSISTAAPLTETRSLGLTRTSTTGSVSAGILLSATTPVPGQTYLIWFPVRAAPGATNRDWTVTWRWLDPSQAVLAATTRTQTEGTGYVDVKGYTWIGILSTVPTGTTQCRVDVLVSNVPAGELHLLDGWYARMFGMDVASLLRARPGETRGRDSDQTGRFPASSHSWVLSNDDGAFTPDHPNAWPVSLRQQCTLVWEWEGLLYPGALGYSTGWKVTPTADGLSDVTLSASGVTSLFARRKIDTPLRAEVLLNRPSGYLPLAEPAEATAAGTLSGEGAIAALQADPDGSAGAAFGYTTSGSLIHSSADPGNGGRVLRFGADVSAGKGDVLNLSTVPGALYGGGGSGWTLAWWGVWANSATTQVFFRQVNSIGGQTGIQVDVTSRNIRLLTPTQSVAATYPGSGNDWGMVAVTYDPSVGSFGQMRIRVWWDGRAYDNPVVASLTLSASPWSNGAPFNAHFGGARSLSTGHVSNPLVGTAEHLALFTHVVADDAGNLVNVVGQTSGFVENEVIRAKVPLDLMGTWRTPLYLDDAGLTTMQQRNWPTQSNVYELASGYLADAAALMYESADGRLEMRNRHHRSNQTTPRFVLEGLLSPARRDLTVQLDEGAHRNVVEVARVNGGRWRLVDQASVDALEVTEATKIEPRVLDDSDAVALGQATLAAYSTPRADVREVVLLLYRGDSALIRAALCLNIGDLITVGDLPDTAPSESVTGFVEKIIPWSDGRLRAMCIKLLISPQDSVVSW